MVSPSSPAPASASLQQTPTGYLLRGTREQLTNLSLFLLTEEGFALEDVRAMVKISKAYTSSKVFERIVGKASSKTVSNTDATVRRLGPLQSARAFQFATVLEHATTVFGSLTLAEGWLVRPCKYLADHVPLDLVDNPIGFQAIEEYLERIELGVYQ
ncbi:antitoxin Xre/MbcA/ParS toxin-binding domain-containing protein [Pseudomonas viridiflava]|uniref:antitoxin Xre/MbcA/ParS toxin-binding domain-containing protein n=1 Tax=Pseudomonas viridiflava TaxID=33069 RepID=UPI000F01DE91|nr:antitoxin Xre/MbcA/ParS toxin-binding domain-containing protein [Pseudomonas viridiflava]